MNDNKVRLINIYENYYKTKYDKNNIDLYITNNILVVYNKCTIYLFNNNFNAYNISITINNIKKLLYKEIDITLNNYMYYNIKNNKICYDKGRKYIYIQHPTDKEKYLLSSIIIKLYKKNIINKKFYYTKNKYNLICNYYFYNYKIFILYNLKKLIYNTNLYYSNNTYYNDLIIQELI